jgi:hypothetical protein|tara:strand:+ start:992 stop:1141 length:150 start_codon:yes stop_codon:yes gene_type:complete
LFDQKYENLAVSVEPSSDVKVEHAFVLLDEAADLVAVRTAACLLGRAVR